MCKALNPRPACLPAWCRSAWPKQLLHTQQQPCSQHSITATQDPDSTAAPCRDIYWAPVLLRTALPQPAAQAHVQLERALSVLRLLRATEAGAQHETHVLDEAVCLVKLGRAAEGCALLQQHLGEGQQPSEAAQRVSRQQACCGLLTCWPRAC